MTKKELLNMIKIEGSYAQCSPYDQRHILDKLVAEGKIETLYQANGSVKDFDCYIYVLKGNPDNVQWKKIDDYYWTVVKNAKVSHHTD